MEQTISSHAGAVTVHSAIATADTARAVAVEAHAEPGEAAVILVTADAPGQQRWNHHMQEAVHAAGLANLTRRIVVRIGDDEKPGPDSWESLGLAIALAVLVTDGQIPRQALSDVAAVGQLGTNGAVTRNFQLTPVLEALSARTVLVPTGSFELVSPRGAIVRRVGSLREAAECVAARAAGLVDLVASPPAAEDKRGDRGGTPTAEKDETATGSRRRRGGRRSGRDRPRHVRRILAAAARLRKRERVA